MKSSRSVGQTGRLSGKSLLTFTSLLVVMFSAPVFADAQFEGTMYGFHKKDKKWVATNIVPKEEARDTFKEAREEALEILAKENGPSTADVEKAFSKFVAKEDKTKNEFVVMTETILDSFKKVSEKAEDKEAKIQKIVDAVKEAVNENPEAFGHHWSKINSKKELNAAGIKMLVEELAKLYKEGKFPTDEKEMNALLKKLFKNTDLLEKLGLTAKKPEDKKPEGKEEGEENNNAKGDKEEKSGKKEDETKTPTPTPAPPVANNVVGGNEQPGVNCAPNNANDLLTKFLQDNLANLAKLQRQNDPNQDLLGLADALNGRRNEDQGQQQQPAQSPITPNQPENRRDEQPQESLAKDQQPPQQPDPSFGDPGVPPIVMNGGVRKPEYKKVAEDGTKEKNELASDISNAKSADKKADSFMTSTLGTLAQQIFLPNGQLNPWGYTNALGQIASMESKLRSTANNLKSSIDWAKARRDALAKEIKKANPEFARSEEAEKTLKELTNAEQTLTQALQTKTSQCNSARMQEERSACESAKSSITNSLQQLKNKKNEQQELIAKSDKNFEEGYVAELKENLTQIEANIKSGEAKLSDVEEKADKLAQQTSQFQSNAMSAMNSTPQGNSTRDKISSYRRGGSSPMGGVMGSASGTGRGSYAPASKGKAF